MSIHRLDSLPIQVLPGNTGNVNMSVIVHEDEAVTECTSFGSYMGIQYVIHILLTGHGTPIKDTEVGVSITVVTAPQPYRVPLSELNDTSLLLSAITYPYK